jgi:putative spermidine/putrescine transport system permease protein
MMKQILWKLALIVLVALLVLPLVIIILWSFTQQWPFPNLIPEVMGLRGYKYLFSPQAKTLSTLASSVFLSSCVMLITLMISLPAAKAFGCYQFKGKKILYYFVLMPLIVPPLTVAMGIHVAFIRMGLANSFLGVILVHLISGLPYAVRILTGVYELMGEQMEMQAKVLGATKLQTLRHVTLPLLAPALVSSGSLVFIISFSQYFITFLIGGGRVVTFAMIMFPYIQSGDRMMASVYSLSFISVTLVVLLIVERLVKKLYKNENYYYL